jgi:hypothetical protein
MLTSLPQNICHPDLSASEQREVLRASTHQHPAGLSASDAEPVEGRSASFIFKQFS